MKKIIQGVRYDTEKATKIGELDNIGAGADSTNDFSYWEAALYVSPRSKRYFLAGEGGPMSRFARPTGQNSMSGGSGIIPMSRDEAFEFAQHHLSAETIEEYFDDMIEDA